MLKLISLLLILTTYSLTAQNYEAKTIDYNLKLGVPMKIDMVLAGNFCEMRSNHFHTGLDIKTNHQEGVKLYAIEDGFISRLKVSPWGYGNAIYIEHTNGLTSLYAHCQKFTPKIDSLVYEIQKAYEKSVIDKDVTPLKIPIKKGEFIGYSGNSGSSSAPHLHFEIRETKTEHAINPLLFKCYQKLIKDTTPPQIRGIKFYAITNKGYMIPDQSKYYPVKKFKGKLLINEGQPINLDDLITENSKLSLGVLAIDKLNAANNTCGIYNISISKDNKLIHEQKTEYMNFDYNRFMNSHKDYNAFKKQRRHIHKQFTTNINPLPIYPLNNGKINWNERNGNYKVIVLDAHGNQLKLEFIIEKKENSYKKNYYSTVSKYIYPDTVNYILKDYFQTLFEPGTFYEPLEVIFKEKEKDSTSKFIGNSYTFADNTIPVQQKYDIRIKCPQLPKSFPKNKLAIIYLDSKKRIKYVGGTYYDGWIEGKVRAFGEFSLMVDSISPIITPLDYNQKKLITKYNTLELKISDNLSGVKSHKAYINKKWVLMYYNRKKGRYIIPLNKYSKPHLVKGQNTIKVVAFDRKNNKKSLETVVIY
jgi:hypothetical protein